MSVAYHRRRSSNYLVPDGYLYFADRKTYIAQDEVPVPGGLSIGPEEGGEFITEEGQDLIVEEDT